MAFNQEQLEKQGIYESKSPLPALLAELDQIAGIAEAVKARQTAKRKTAVWIMLGGLVGAVVFGIFVPPLLVVAILATIGGFGYWVSTFMKGDKLTDHPLRLDIVKGRIAMIQQDASAQAPFSLRLILCSNPTKISDEAWRGRKGGKQELYEEAWLSLEGRMLDGTVLTDEIKELTRKRTFTNARGKRKNKSRISQIVNVRFTYPKEVYGDARPAEKALHGEVKVASSAVLRSVRVSEKAITMKALVRTEKDILATTGMLSVGGYRILNLARRLASGQKGNTK